VSTDRDVLGELVRAAGRRTAPERGDYEYVLLAARSAWQKKLQARRRQKWMLALAASVIAAAGGVVTIRHWMPGAALPVVATTVVLHGNAAVRSSADDAWRPLHIGAGIVAGSHLRTGATAGLAFELADGVSARLDRQSELEIDSSRLMRLIAGAIYVDTGPAHPASDTRSPNDAWGSGALRIETAIGTVSDVGTVFQIRAEHDALRIQVREGLVQLDVPNHSAHYQSAAGEELAVDQYGTARRAPFEATHRGWAWAEALAESPEVEGHSLLQFLAWVAHETGRTLQFQGADVEAQARAVVLHGKTLDLTPLQALDLMLSTTDLEYMLSADEAIIIRRRQQ
jgi:FecR protein